ncbi:hypothetical protein Tco_1451621, partial [Tanacetum coccineum]
MTDMLTELSYFVAYSDLCARKVSRWRSVDLSQATSVVDFPSKEATSSEVFLKYKEVCAPSLTTTCFVNPSRSLHAKGTHPISLSVSNHYIKTWVNFEASISAVATTNFSRNGSATRGGNPQPVYNGAKNFPFTHNEDPNHTRPSVSNRHNRKAENSQAITKTGEVDTSKRVRHPPVDVQINYHPHLHLFLGPSVSNRRKRTPGNSQAIPTTYEVGTSTRVRRPPNGCSNRLPPTRAYANIEGCSSAAGAGSLPAYDDLGDCNQHCRHCGATF